MYVLKIYGYPALPMAVNFFLARWLLLWVPVNCLQVGSQLISKTGLPSLHLLSFLSLWLYDTQGSPFRIQNKAQFLVKSTTDTSIYPLPIVTRSASPPTVYRSLEVPASGGHSM